MKPAEKAGALRVENSAGALRVENSAGASGVLRAARAAHAVARSQRWRRGRWWTAGQSLPLVAVLLPLLFSVVGLALDGGVVFAARRELQSVADAAARAGATEVSVEHFRTTGAVLLVPRAAADVAETWIGEYNLDRGTTRRVVLDGPVEVAQDWIVVRVAQRAETAFVRLFGIEAVLIRAEALARARAGGQ